VAGFFQKKVILKGMRGYTMETQHTSVINVRNVSVMELRYKDISKFILRKSVYSVLIVASGMDGLNTLRGINAKRDQNTGNLIYVASHLNRRQV